MQEGIEVIAELEDGICLAKVELSALVEQDVNARVMDDAKFGQLVENIRKRGTLEQLPYCALTDRGVEIVSGHHRTRAARLAGLKEVDVLLDRSKLTRSAIAAKQLAHNAIEGVDDEDMVRRIAAIITDVDDMLESAIDQKFFEKAEQEAKQLPQVKVDWDWKTVQFQWLPEDFGDFDRLVEQSGKAELEGVAPLPQFDSFVEALKKTEKFCDVKNVGVAVSVMVKKALGEYSPDDCGEVVPVARVFGRAAIPKETADKLKAKVNDLIDEGLIENPWELFDYVAGVKSDGQA